MRAALALLALAVPAACFVSPQRRLAARPLFAEENADFDPNAKVSQLDEVLIQWGIKDDPRVPEECRVDPDCPALMSCLDGECVDPCRQNNPCQGRRIKFNSEIFKLDKRLGIQLRIQTCLKN